MSVEYLGDPLLQPIRSFENPYLVRALHRLSSALNEKVRTYLFGNNISCRKIHVHTHVGTGGKQSPCCPRLHVVTGSVHGDIGTVEAFMNIPNSFSGHFPKTYPPISISNTNCIRLSGAMYRVYCMLLPSYSLPLSWRPLGPVIASSTNSSFSS